MKYLQNKPPRFTLVQKILFLPLCGALIGFIQIDATLLPYALKLLGVGVGGVLCLMIVARIAISLDEKRQERKVIQSSGLLESITPTTYEDYLIDNDISSIKAA